MENDYKRYNFADILNDGVEQKNLELRKLLGSLQEKFESKELVHNGVLEQLKAMEKKNILLEKAAKLEKAAFDLVHQLKITRRKKKMAPGLHMEIDDFGAEQGHTGATVHETNTFSAPFVDSTTGTAEMEKMLFHGHNQTEGHPQQFSGTHPWTTF